MALLMVPSSTNDVTAMEHIPLIIIRYLPNESTASIPFDSISAILIDNIDITGLVLD
jgi:hypothetical protein